MYALDNSSGVTVMPEVKNQQFQPNAPRWFTEGGNGVAPSYPGADWFNIVQAELLNILKDGGITPNKGQFNQITQAIKAIVTQAANEKWQSASETQEGLVAISHKTDGRDKTKAASEFALGEVGKKSLPVGAVIAFPRAVEYPVGFLRCDGSVFAQQTYPDLYRTLGNCNQLPNLTRSDVGMLAYFPMEAIPSGWLKCEGQVISSQDYPELYRYLGNKYGASGKLPNAEDRFIRNAGNGLAVGQTQEDEIKRHTHTMRSFKTPSGVSGKIYGDNYEFNQDESNLNNSIVDTWGDSTLNDNGWLKPSPTSKYASGGDETRPKSIAFALCIKAQNQFDEVQFWIKAFGEAINVGQMDASRLAQDIQQVRVGKADLHHQHNVVDIVDFAQGVANTFVYQKIGNFEIHQFPDGTMIQTYKLTNPRGITSNFTELHQFTWAVAFTKSPQVWVTQSSDENTNSASDNLNVAVSINSFIKINNFKSSGAVCAYWEYNGDNDGDYKGMNWDFLAIGRWK